jgi:ACT domain-containing protein
MNKEKESKQPNKTLHNKKALLEALDKSMGIVTTACKIVGVSRWTFYEYYKTDADFKEKVDDISNLVLDFAESKLHKAIETGNITAIIFYLKTKGKDRGYVERVENYYKADNGNFPEWLEDETEG